MQWTNDSCWNITMTVWMFQASGIILHMLQIVYFNNICLVICVCKHSTVTRQCHEWTIHFGTKQWYILQIRRKQEWWILKRNKKLRMLIFGNWNKTRTNSFLDMWKSSSNVPNVFEGSSLTGHRVWPSVDIENRMDIYYILLYFLFYCAYLKILNANNKFCCLHINIYLSEVNIPSFLDCVCLVLDLFTYNLLHSES